MELFGLFFEPFNPLLSIFFLVSLHPFIHVVLPEFDHSVDQPSQMMRHRHNRLGRPEFGAESAVFSPKPRLTIGQAIGA